MNSKQPDPRFNQTEVTLRFLANSVYQDVMEKKTEVSDPTKSDYKFYRKRSFAMMKEMMKGKYPSESLKELHMKYVSELINYMKIQDTTDILQSDYPPKSPPKNTDASDDISSSSGEIMDEANKLMMKESDADVPTMDDFVTKKIIRVKVPVPPPTVRIANIKTDEHKTKGLKKKKKKAPQKETESKKEVSQSGD